MCRIMRITNDYLFANGFSLSVSSRAAGRRRRSGNDAGRNGSSEPLHYVDREAHRCGERKRINRSETKRSSDMTNVCSFRRHRRYVTNTLFIFFYSTLQCRLFTSIFVVIFCVRAVFNKLQANKSPKTTGRRRHRLLFALVLDFLRSCLAALFSPRSSADMNLKPAESFHCSGQKLSAALDEWNQSERCCAPKMRDKQNDLRMKLGARRANGTLCGVRRPFYVHLVRCARFGSRPRARPEKPFLVIEQIDGANCVLHARTRFIWSANFQYSPLPEALVVAHVSRAQPRTGGVALRRTACRAGECIIAERQSRKTLSSRACKSARPTKNDRVLCAFFVI